MMSIKVILKENSYTILIGSSLFQDNNYVYPFKIDDRVMLVTNEKVFRLWGKKLIFHMRKLGVYVDKIILPDGEQYKTLKTLNIIVTKLLKKNHNRNSKLIALGGGVIGDLTGFAASVYQRGINYIQIPTTLLAQVDASIGGKTAVNHLLAKNMIGTFWQPMKVIVDTNFLKTLPKNEFISGMAEVIKYAITFDLQFFCWLENNYLLLLKLDDSAIKYCIEKCCKIKSIIVSKDEKENGDRALLNLGHTYGHAIESFTNYNTWLHGESIAVGMIMAAHTSNFLGKILDIDVIRIINLIKKIGLPFKGPKEMNVLSYLTLMKRDKKNFDIDNLRLVLPIAIGKAEIFEIVDQNLIIKAISKCTTNV